MHAFRACIQENGPYGFQEPSQSFDTPCNELWLDSETCTAGGDEPLITEESITDSGLLERCLALAAGEPMAEQTCYEQF